ncbi:hypothetical protein ACQJBY_001435 [Aegilops geniculata]
MNKLSGALCLRRLWLRWTPSHLPNLGLLDPCDDDDFAVFATTSRVTTGKWQNSSVLEGFMAKRIGDEKCSPALFIAYARKSRMVADALKRDSWVHNLERVWTDGMMEELLTFANLLQHITLAPAVNGQIIWKLKADRVYSASSAYHFQFEAITRSKLYNSVWEVWMSVKYKIFLWMAMERKILTADMRLLRGTENNYFCRLCMCSLNANGQSGFGKPSPTRLVCHRSPQKSGTLRPLSLNGLTI